MKMFVAQIADSHRVRPGHGKPGEILTISFRGLRENCVVRHQKVMENDN